MECVRHCILQLISCTWNNDFGDQENNAKIVVTKALMLIAEGEEEGSRENTQPTSLPGGPFSLLNSAGAIMSQFGSVCFNYQVLLVQNLGSFSEKLVFS